MGKYKIITKTKEELGLENILKENIKIVIGIQSKIIKSGNSIVIPVSAFFDEKDKGKCIFVGQIEKDVFIVKVLENEKNSRK